MKKVDVAIFGGGLVGLALALALRSTGARIALVERGPAAPGAITDGWDVRVYAISPGNVAFLDSLGAWHADAERVCAVTRMDVRGDAGGHLEFDAMDGGEAALAWIVESRWLSAGLWEKVLAASQIEVLAGIGAASLRWDGQGAEATLANGETLAADLIIGADGAHSWVREQAGIRVNLRDYHQLGVVANFATGFSPGGCARQWFGADGSVLAWLPLPGNRMSMVWSVDEASARELLALPASELAARVADAGGNALGALEVITPAAGFPLRRGRAETVVKTGLALVGDAAHTVHPLAGQGVNLGFQDAAVLAGVLEDRGRAGFGDEILLARYARARVESVLAIQTVTDSLQRLFAAPGMGWLRNTGLTLTGRTTFLRKALTRHALT